MVERPSRSRTKTESVNATIVQSIEPQLFAELFQYARGHQIDITLNYNSALPAECLRTFAAKRTLKRHRKTSGGGCLPVSGTLKRHARIIQQDSRGHARFLDY